jgi:hypothetical protein
MKANHVYADKTHVSCSEVDVLCRAGFTSRSQHLFGVGPNIAGMRSYFSKSESRDRCHGGQSEQLHAEVRLRKTRLGCADTR